MYKGRALISVSNKEEVDKFARALANLGIEIISTGGTARFLRKKKILVTEVADVTGFPEILEGRVKTLHPIIFGGILARRENTGDVRDLAKHTIETIDFVVCNLYPFEATIKKQGATMDEIIENIDIGGSTLIRAAAKNYKDVVIVTNIGQYESIIHRLKQKGFLPLKEKKELAVKAFAHTAQYDAIIADHLNKKWTKELFPESKTITMRKKQEMRYGENPHQKGVFYKSLPEVNEPCITNAKKLHGKELSYNNVLDGNAGIECIKEFSDPTCVIIKHNTPCGIASAKSLIKSWENAYATDTYSPFGGVVVFNRKIDKKLAKKLSRFFLELVIAPSFSNEALALFRNNEKKKNLRLLEIEELNHEKAEEELVCRSVARGYLFQEKDTKLAKKDEWKVVTKKKPTKEQTISMEFAIKCVKHVKSNSVVFVKETKTVAVGGGQTARVDATWIATHKGKENIKDSIMASDAFFPFRDAVDIASEAGVSAIIQPGGSIRDEEVIKAADQHSIAMVFSGQRYFRH